jgi:hypothetical protein
MEDLTQKFTLMTQSDHDELAKVHRMLMRIETVNLGLKKKTGTNGGIDILR